MSPNNTEPIVELICTRRHGKAEFDAFLTAFNQAGY